MRAKYVGKDKSMGLKKGKYYDIIIEEGRSYIWLSTEENGGRKISVPYSNERTLFQNWQPLEVGGKNMKKYYVALPFKDELVYMINGENDGFDVVYSKDLADKFTSEEIFSFDNGEGRYWDFREGVGYE